MTPRPPRSTLFPYTTLFRSGEVALRIAAVAAAIDHLMNERKRRISGQMRAASAVRFERERVVMLGSRRHEVVIEDIEDRKSTRLNSSHGYISYAVFCLKKKK